MERQAHKFYLNRVLSLFSSILLVLITVGGASANGDASAGRNAAMDFDGDGKADVSVFRQSEGNWYILKSSGGSTSSRWGLATDTLVPADYDGDGKTDIAVYRYGDWINSGGVANNTWYVLRSSDNTFVAKNLGTVSLGSFDAPVPADYDGDGTTDFAVYNNQDYIPAPGYFTILQSSNNARVVKHWGTNADKRVPADYDGDGKADLAVYRHDSYFGKDQVGVWFILQSSNNQMRVERFGLPADKVVPGDYDGDKKADLAVWRPSNGTWYCLNSGSNSFYAMQFGVNSDKPVPADYDGDKKVDFAVFRPATGTWYLQGSKEGFSAQFYGIGSDVPLANASIR